MKQVKTEVESVYTIEGLEQDFASTAELEKFVYDETGHALSLKGKSKSIKYAAALATLEGRLDEVPHNLLSTKNPYVDNGDLVPMEELKPVPERDPVIPERRTQTGVFSTSMLNHPDANENAQGHKCSATFRAYRDGTITYEITGPVDQRPQGSRINKYGVTQAAEIKWSDPRTGEQVLQYPNGQLTTVGAALKANLENLSGFNAWAKYLAKSLISVDREVLKNPWKQ